MLYCYSASDQYWTFDCGKYKIISACCISFQLWFCFKFLNTAQILNFAYNEVTCVQKNNSWMTLFALCFDTYGCYIFTSFMSLSKIFTTACSCWQDSKIFSLQIVQDCKAAIPIINCFDSISASEIDADVQFSWTLDMQYACRVLDDFGRQNAVWLKIEVHIFISKITSVCIKWNSVSVFTISRELPEPIILSVVAEK